MIGAMEKPTADRREPALRHEPAHDVLAAEEFVMPAPDPALRHEPAHDVLAAEEFVMPAPDPTLHHHGPIVLPSDPTGLEEAHDVLAAEEFALPAPPPTHAVDTGAAGAGPARGTLIAAAVGALAVVLARRRRRAGRKSFG
jgi:hypothetical protein